MLLIKATVCSEKSYFEESSLRNWKKYIAARSKDEHQTIFLLLSHSNLSSSRRRFDAQPGGGRCMGV